MDASGWHYYGVPGAGDIIGSLPDGRHLEVECKAGKGGSLSAKQQERMKRVRDHNGVYLVVHSLAELEDQMSYYLSEGEVGISFEDFKKELDL